MASNLTAPLKDSSWTGTFVLLRTVAFSQKGGRGRHGFAGTADVYAFAADDPKCKVTHAAVIRGVDMATMCGSSGDVGAAVLRSAGLYDRAKNAGVRGDYDTFPEPIGRPADRLQEMGSAPKGSEPVSVLTFYRKK